MRVYHQHQAVYIMRTHGLVHFFDAFKAAEVAELPLPVACALLEKESGGANVWGHDAGGVFSGLSGHVTAELFRAFLWEIQHNGRTSNGVGPCQITWPGHFTEMERRQLRPWIPFENMVYGFGLLKTAHDRAGADWVDAGTAFNGAREYGFDLVDKIHTWRARLAPAEVT